MEKLKRIIKMMKNKLITKWDPQYTKVTLLEKVLLKKSDIEMANGMYFTEEEIWKEKSEYEYERMKAKRNADYLAMIDKSMAEAEAGGFIKK